MRLNGTICMYGDKPVYVRTDDDRQEKDTIFAWPLGHTGEHGKRFSVKVSDEAFSYMAPTLGYIDWMDNVYYLSRAPIRQNHAGLPRDYITTNPPIRGNDYFYSKNMERCILGKHPKYTTAFNRVLSGKAKGVPFHRHFAVASYDGIRIGIFHRTRLVGVYDNYTESFNLLPTPDLSFIRKMLEKLRVDLR